MRRGPHFFSSRIFKETFSFFFIHSGLEADTIVLENEEISKSQIGYVMNYFEISGFSITS